MSDPKARAIVSANSRVFIGVTWRHRQCGLLHAAVRIDDKLRRGAPIEILVALGSLIQRNDLHVDGLRDVDPVVEDGHHQAAVVFHDRRLAGQSECDTIQARVEGSDCRFFAACVVGSRILRDVQAGNADRAPPHASPPSIDSARWRVEIDAAVPLRFKAHAIDGAIDFGYPQNLLDALDNRAAL